MNTFLNRMKWSLYRLMSGRYGNDALGIALLILSFLINLVGTFFPTQRTLFAILAYLPVLWALYRIFSRKISTRRKENQAFLNLVKPFRKEGKRLHLNLTQKAYRHYSCPSCGQLVRVPSGRGRIEISCPSCRHTFVKKT